MTVGQLLHGDRPLVGRIDFETGEVTLHGGRPAIGAREIDGWMAHDDLTRHEREKAEKEAERKAKAKRH